MNNLCTPPSCNLAAPARSEQDFMSIFHPGYEPPVLLLRLFKFDTTAEGAHGVHLGTALRACEIVANNTHGFLSTSPDRSDMHAFVSDAELDSCLVQPQYYYHAVHADFSLRQYPVCANFESWTPPTTLPAEWQRYSERVPAFPSSYASLFALNIESKTPDYHCCITGWRSGLQTTHLIPETEEDWFNATETNNVTDGVPPVVHSNLITLRSDMKAILDEHVFTLVPRGPKADIVAVFLQSGAREAAHLYHNRIMRLPERVSTRYLYCRFAWTVLGLVQRYCKFPPPDFVIVPSVMHVQPEVAEESIAQQLFQTEDDDYSQLADELRVSDELELSEFDAFVVPSPPRENLFFRDEEDMKRKLEILEVADARLTEMLGPYYGEDGWSFDCDDDADLYPGFSKYRRMAYEYIQRTPSVRACGDGEHTPVSDDSENYSLVEDEMEI